MPLVSTAGARPGAPVARCHPHPSVPGGVWRPGQGSRAGRSGGTRGLGRGGLEGIVARGGWGHYGQDYSRQARAEGIAFPSHPPLLPAPRRLPGDLKGGSPTLRRGRAPGRAPLRPGKTARARGGGWGEGGSSAGGWAGGGRRRLPEERPEGACCCSAGGRRGGRGRRPLLAPGRGASPSGFELGCRLLMANAPHPDSSLLSSRRQGLAENREALVARVGLSPGEELRGSSSWR